jgi:hypothetical protein
MIQMFLSSSHTVCYVHGNIQEEEAAKMGRYVGSKSWSRSAQLDVQQHLYLTNNLSCKKEFPRRTWDRGGCRGRRSLQSGSLRYPREQLCTKPGTATRT